ncbi:MAG: hypothetical protein F6K58_24350 [Symploca sp. SIO2E9]|nr:hypothetical protein [Symploca sp. SIO2E9]
MAQLGAKKRQKLLITDSGGAETPPYFVEGGVVHVLICLLLPSAIAKAITSI